MVSENFAADNYAAFMGLVLESSDPITVSLELTSEHQNFHGSTHGGVLFSVADCAFSLASNAAGVPAVAIDTHLALTAPADVGDTLVAVAEEMTRGRSLATYRVTVTRRSDDRTCGLFTGTVYIKN